MVWSRLVGHTTVDMITPRWWRDRWAPLRCTSSCVGFGSACSVAALLGSALVVSATHVIYSGHVKAYTAEVLFVLALFLAVPWLARRSWRVSTAVGWFAGSMLLASFSSFTLLVTVGAAIILVLHPRNDLRLRLAAVTAQAVGVLALLAALDRTHSSELLNSYFAGFDSFISLSANPLTFGRDVFHHLTRITAVFPGGPSWFQGAWVVIVAVGLGAAAVRRGPCAIAARFMIVLVLLAFVGALAKRVPFGPNSETFRVTLWLVPIVAFGLAVVLQRVREPSPNAGPEQCSASTSSRSSCAGLLLLTPIGVRRPYPPGWQAATHRVMATIGPQDVVLVARTTMYSFAFNADLPIRIQPRPETVQGFDPLFRDKRLHTVGPLTASVRQDIDRVVKPVDRVVVFEPNAANTYQPYRIELPKELKRQGFVRESVEVINHASIVVYRRK